MRVWVTLARLRLGLGVIVGVVVGVIVLIVVLVIVRTLRILIRILLLPILLAHILIGRGNSFGHLVHNIAPRALDLVTRIQWVNHLDPAVTTNEVIELRLALIHILTGIADEYLDIPCYLLLESAEFTRYAPKLTHCYIRGIPSLLT